MVERYGQDRDQGEADRASQDRARYESSTDEECGVGGSEVGMMKNEVKREKEGMVLITTSKSSDSVKRGRLA